MSWERQRTDFQAVEFYKIIKQKGYLVTWEKSSICPCIPKDNNGQPDFNCSLCHGKGRFWYDPKTIEGIMTNFNEEVKFNQVGEIMTGTNYFTTLPEYKIGFWDRITHKHSVVRYSEIVEKGEIGKTDLLRFIPQTIIMVRSVDKEFDKDVDYRFDAKTNSIDWISIGSSQPERGQRYTVEYLTNPRWIVIDLVNVIRDTYVKAKKPGITFQQLPLRALVRLEFFVNNSYVS